MNIFNIDLHYHCGLERQSGYSMEDYIKHAKMSGRKVIGITDHIQKYIGCKEEENRLYSVGVKGLLELYQDVVQCRENNKDLTILFAPEISLDFDFDLLPRELIDVCDYFICEPPIKDGDHTELILKRMGEMALFRQNSGKPLFLAHPLRHAINQRVFKCKEIEPCVTEMAYHEDWKNYSLSQVNDFFWVNVNALGRASYELDIPIEINGGTHARALNTNLFSVIQIYTAANGLMKEQGAQFVCGSDQHTFIQDGKRSGRYVPQRVFQDLGIGIEEIHFLKNFNRKD